MLDKIELRIPIDSSLVEVDSDGRHAVFGIALLDIKSLRVASREVHKRDDGSLATNELFCPYATLPTSFTGMAFKFQHDSVHSFPYVEIKASPAKILQGHNVFGSDWIKEGALEMLGWLQEAHPDLYGLLHIESAEVMLLDVTYSVRLRDDDQVDQALSFLRNFSSRGIRKAKDRKIDYKNTVYFGSARCKWLARKLYGKATEFFEQLEHHKKLAKKNDFAAQRVVSAMSDPRLQAWVKGLLRIETGMKRAWLQKLGIPTNLFELIKYQELNPDVLKHLWLKANEEMFKALEGEMMDVRNHQEVFKTICQNFETVTPSGRVSLTKARNVFNFYCGLELLGCEMMKSKYSEAQYFRYMSDLISCGFSKAFLQNLGSGNNSNVIPFVRMIEMKFDEQLPDWFIEPISTFRFKYRNFKPAKAHKLSIVA